MQWTYSHSVIDVADSCELPSGSKLIVISFHRYDNIDTPQKSGEILLCLSAATLQVISMHLDLIVHPTLDLFLLRALLSAIPI